MAPITKKIDEKENTSDRTRAGATKAWVVISAGRNTPAVKLVADEMMTYTRAFGACDRAASSKPTRIRRYPDRCSGTPMPLIIHCWVHRPDIRMPRNVHALPSATTSPRQKVPRSKTCSRNSGPSTARGTRPPPTIVAAR